MRCEECERAGFRTNYYRDGSCMKCYSDSVVAWAEAVREGSCDSGGASFSPDDGADWYYTGTACLHGKHPVRRAEAGGKCLTCIGPRAEARRLKQYTYTPVTPCDGCNTTGERRVSDDRCFTCFPRKLKSDPNRAAARKVCAPRYTPSTPCKDCGTTAERDTQTNRCFGCNPAKPMGRAPDPAIVTLLKNCPDMVISSSRARSLGMKIYRSGNACQNGHKSWRYVNGGACLACLGRA